MLGYIVILSLLIILGGLLIRRYKKYKKMRRKMKREKIKKYEEILLGLRFAR